MLTTDEKSNIIRKYATSKTDTGSPAVQVALLTSQIDKLVDHLKDHKKDNHSRRGLLKIVSKRRRLLNYLGKINPKMYEDISKDLGLSKTVAVSTSN